MSQTEPPDPLEYELQEGRAYALGQAGRRVETTLASLATAERVPAAERERLLDDASEAVWIYVIIRESLGFYDHEIALSHYHVPAQVMARIGVVRRTR